MSSIEVTPTVDGATSASESQLQQLVSNTSLLSDSGCDNSSININTPSNGSLVGSQQRFTRENSASTVASESSIVDRGAHSGTGGMSSLSELGANGAMRQYQEAVRVAAVSGHSKTIKDILREGAADGPPLCLNSSGLGSPGGSTPTPPSVGGVSRGFTDSISEASQTPPPEPIYH